MNDAVSGAKDVAEGSDGLGRGARVFALLWVAVVVLAYVALRELGIAPVP